MFRRSLLVALMLATACGRVHFESAASLGGDGGADGGMDAALDASGIPGARCGNGRVEGDEVCDDGNSVDGDGCRADCSAREICGDGVVAGEVCDDGNSVDGDGCDNDCTFSCMLDAECDDDAVCNGTETCGADHACIEGDPLADGLECDAARVCHAGSCALASCGDGRLDPGEDCDDANETNGDGCDNDCSFSCIDDVGCADENPCTTEVCIDHVCDMDATAPNGTTCDRDGLSATIDLCLGGTCARSVCGDGWVDSAAGEDCDDDNLVNGDGCDNDCTFSCTSDAECSDGEPCNGSEICELGPHACRRGMALPDGTTCPGGLCASGECRMVGMFDGATPLDSGSPDAGASDSGSCPTPPTADMPLSCFKECSTDADCVYANAAGSCCCGCAESGVSEAINWRTTSAWDQRTGCVTADCTGISCFGVYVCGGPPTCVAGQCQGGGAV